MKKRHFATDFSVGFVLFVATVVVIASLFLVGDGQNFFADHVEFKVPLPNAGGLKTGSKVFLAGVQAGSIKRIDFPEDLTATEVLVTLSIEKGYKDRIREDSFAWKQTEGLLGDASVHVKLGTASQPVLSPGSTLRFKAHVMLDELAGEEMSASTTDMIKQFTAVLKEVNQGQGSLGQLIKNPELYNNLSNFTASMAVLTKEVQTISTELEGIITEVKSQRGTLGQLIFSEDYARSFSSAVRDASGLIASLREVTDAVKAGKGSVGKLFAGPELYDAGKKAFDDIGRATERIDALLAKAEASGSVLGRVMTDERMGRSAEDLIARLDRSAASLEKVLARVEHGEGSLGMLVNDPSVATSLRDIFRGVSESGLLVNAVRNAERDGRETYLRDASLVRHEAEEVLRVRALRRLETMEKPGMEDGGLPVPAAGTPERPRATPVPAAGPAQGEGQRNGGTPPESIRGK